MCVKFGGRGGEIVTCDCATFLIDILDDIFIQHLHHDFFLDKEP